MPSFVCQHPTCDQYLPERGFCEKHRQTGRRAAAYYDRHLRSSDAKNFYNSAVWCHPKRGARARKLAHDPVCERCKVAFAAHVHHVKPLADCAPAERVDPLNLMSVCVPCHNAIEAAARKAGAA